MKSDRQNILEEILVLQKLIKLDPNNIKNDMYKRIIHNLEVRYISETVHYYDI